MRACPKLRSACRMSVRPGCAITAGGVPKTVVCSDEDLRLAGVQSAAECGSEAPNGGRFVVEIVFELYETQSRRLETTNFVVCKRQRHQHFFLVRVSPACNHQQEPARCDEVCNPDDRPLSLGCRQDLQGVRFQYEIERSPPFDWTVE